MATLADVRKKWHIPPAFSVEFIGYYLDRISRSREIKNNLQQQLELNKTLVTEQQHLREKYDEVKKSLEKRVYHRNRNKIIRKSYILIDNKDSHRAYGPKTSAKRFGGETSCYNSHSLS